MKVDYKKFNPVNLKYTVDSQTKETINNGKKTSIEFFIITVNYNYLGPDRGEDKPKSSGKRYEKLLIQPPICLSKRGFQSNDKFGGEQICCAFTKDLGMKNSNEEPITKYNPTDEELQIWREVATELRDSVLKFISENYSLFKYSKNNVKFDALSSQPLQAKVCNFPDEEEEGKSPALFAEPAKYISKTDRSIVYTVEFIEPRRKGNKIVDYIYKYRDLRGKCIVHLPVIDFSRIYAGGDMKIRFQPSIKSSIVYDTRKFSDNCQEEELEERKRTIDISEIREYDHKDDDIKEVEEDLKDLLGNKDLLEDKIKDDSDEEDVIDDVIKSKKDKKKKKNILKDISNDSDEEDNRVISSDEVKKKKKSNK